VPPARIELATPGLGINLNSDKLLFIPFFSNGFFDGKTEALPYNCKVI